MSRNKESKPRRLQLSNFELVKEFHQAFDLPILEAPHIPNQKREDLRVELIEEEFQELLTALRQEDIVGVADALTDLNYVIYGMALEFGIDLDKCFQEVHASNMSKLGKDGKPLYRRDGKVLKGPDFRSPNLRKVLFPD